MDHLGYLKEEIADSVSLKREHNDGYGVNMCEVEGRKTEGRRRTQFKEELHEERNLNEYHLDTCNQIGTCMKPKVTIEVESDQGTS